MNREQCCICKKLPEFILDGKPYCIDCAAKLPKGSVSRIEMLVPNLKKLFNLSQKN